MKAAVIRQHGSLDQIQIEKRPDPEPGPGEAVVDVRAAALNHLDIWVRKGSRAGGLKLPHALGSDGAGIVSAVGPGVEGPRVGDKVLINPGLSCGGCEWCLRGEQSECPSFGLLGASRPGTFAEKTAVPARNLAPIPEHLNFEEAAALPLAHTTAWRMLMSRARVRPGETVLIHGIGGGVALATLQLCRLSGALAIVTSSSDDKLSRARELGAAFGFNYTTGADVGRQIRDFTGGRGVDVSINTVGAMALSIDLAAVRRGGRIVLCGVTAGAEAALDLQALYWNQIQLLGSTMGSAGDFAGMLRAVSAAKLRPVVDTVLSLDKVREATHRMERGDQFGKIVLRVPG